MPNVTHHQGNANQYHNEISPHLSERLVRKRQEITSTGKDVEKREPSCTVGRNVKWYSHGEKQYGVSSRRLKIKISYDPLIPLLGINPNKTKTLI